MTQGVFIYGSRPKTKKALKEQIDQINSKNADPYSVVIEATSLFGNEFDGSIAQAMNCLDNNHDHENSIDLNGTPSHPGPFYLVGPDPYSKRNWYASLTYDPDTKKWKVK